MIQKVSRFISIIGHPVFIPVLAVLIMTHLHYMIAARLIPETKWIFIAAYILSLTVVPLLGISLMLKKYHINELSNLTTDERKSASLVLAAVYFFIAFTFKTLFVDKILMVFVVSLAVSGLVLSISSRFFKISFHAFGWAGLVVLMFVIAPNAIIKMDWLIVITFIAGAIVTTARLVLQAHKHKEVYLGYLFGLICNIAVYSFYYGI